MGLRLVTWGHGYCTERWSTTVKTPLIRITRTTDVVAGQCALTFRKWGPSRAMLTRPLAKSR